MFCDISNEPGTVPSISAVKLLLALPVLFSKYQLSVHSKYSDLLLSQIKFSKMRLLLAKTCYFETNVMIFSTTKTYNLLFEY